MNDISLSSLESTYDPILSQGEIAAISVMGSIIALSIITIIVAEFKNTSKSKFTTTQAIAMIVGGATAISALVWGVVTFPPSTPAPLLVGVGTQNTYAHHSYTPAAAPTQSGDVSASIHEGGAGDAIASIDWGPTKLFLTSEPGFYLYGAVGATLVIGLCMWLLREKIYASVGKVSQFSNSSNKTIAHTPMNVSNL